MQSEILMAHSLSGDARQAVREFHAAVAQDNMALVVFFCSSSYELSVLAEELNVLFPTTPVIGCTTAGEIGPLGYQHNGLSGFSLPGEYCQAVVGHLDDLQHFSAERGETLVRSLRDELENKAPGEKLPNRFGLMLIDGLSVREELVVRAFQSGLGNIPLVGGSAADDAHFKKTWVFHDGAFHQDGALLALVATEYPFYPFKTQHFHAEEERLVVTEADVETRTVHEINGLPADEEYARLVGVDVKTLSPQDFASVPVVVVIDGTDYVRSIQKANPDGSLTFYSAIDEGLVLRVARGSGLVENLQEAFDELHRKIGPPQLVIACDCILRSLEIVKHGQQEAIGEIFCANRTVGFNTYGEQYAGVHVNQTLTAIALGYPKAN